MPKIYWYGPAYGNGSTGDRVSHTYPVAKALRRVANDIAHDAAFLLDSRSRLRRQGEDGSAEIKTLHYPATQMDSYAYLIDPNNKGAAQGIENGHWTWGYRKRRDGTLGSAEGPIRNGRDGDGGGSRWVEGLHVLRDAAASVTFKG
jgi:hypothetical protein